MRAKVTSLPPFASAAPNADPAGADHRNPHCFISPSQLHEPDHIGPEPQDHASYKFEA